MLIDNTIPCSVPTKYLVGPASVLYAIELPPSTVPAGSSTGSSPLVHQAGVPPEHLTIRTDGRTQITSLVRNPEYVINRIMDDYSLLQMFRVAQRRFCASRRN